MPPLLAEVYRYAPRLLKSAWDPAGHAPQRKAAWKRPQDGCPRRGPSGQSCAGDFAKLGLPQSLWKDRTPSRRKNVGTLVGHAGNPTLSDFIARALVLGPAVPNRNHAGRARKKRARLAAWPPTGPLNREKLVRPVTG